MSTGACPLLIVCISTVSAISATALKRLSAKCEPWKLLASTPLKGYITGLKSDQSTV